jgi:hypothetical protein
MKIRLAIALLFLLPQTVLAESFKDQNRVIIRGLSPSTKYTIQYQQRVIIWKRYTVDRCGTIILKKREAAGILGDGNSYEFRSDDDEKTITSVFITDSQRSANRAAVNWDSKDSTKLNYKCTNGEIGKNLDPYWVNVGSGIRFLYHGRQGTQGEKMYITGIESSNVHIRSLNAPDNGPSMKRTLTSDRCGQLFIRHNAKYPASGLGAFVISPFGPGYQSGNYYNYFGLSESPTSTRCNPPFNIIP